MSDPNMEILVAYLRKGRKEPAGFLYTRQDLTGHDPAQALPYPVTKCWFKTTEAAEEWATKARDHFNNDPNQLIRVRPAEGKWSIKIEDLDAPEGSKPDWLTYDSPAYAKAMRTHLMQRNPRLLITVEPFISPEKNPPRRYRTVDPEPDGVAHGQSERCAHRKPGHCRISGRVRKE